MRIGVASDHGGFDLKEELVKQLREAGHEIVEFGAYELNESDDYPDYVIPLAKAVAAQEVERGVAICGSGVGASVCANKIPGVRAALIHDHFSARQGVEDDHMWVPMCLVYLSAILAQLARWFSHPVASAPVTNKAL